MANERRKNWQPPDDMPPEDVEACLSGKMCGAKLKTPTPSGRTYCRQHPVPGQTGGYPHRCKWHGGCGGAPQGNSNSLKHGIYSKALLPGEEEFYEQIKVGDLDEEIRLTKIRLRRAFIAEMEQAELLESEDSKDQQKALTVESTDTDTERTGESKAKVTKTRVVRKARDYGVAVHNIVNQLYKLMQQRSLMQDGDGLDAAEKAKIIRELLTSMDAGLHEEEDQG